jgi:hypothetical protein
MFVRGFARVLPGECYDGAWGEGEPDNGTVDCRA